MRARVAAAAFLLILVVSASAPAALAEATVRLGLLAVKEGDNGFEGVVIGADVSVSPGAGTVRLEPAGMVDESTVASTRAGFMLATALAGKSYTTMSMRVVFHTDTPVGGPSASGFLASTVLLLSLGYAPDAENATMTGMVSPSGLILSVAGVAAKVRAAAEAGYRLVLVPASEDTGLVKGENIRVAPVCSIVEAAEELANITLASPAAAPRVPVPGMFAEDAERFINYSEKLAPVLDNRTRRAVESLVAEARRVLGSDPYTAASLAFTALLRAANYTAATRGFGEVERLLGVSLEEALRSAEEAVGSASYEAGQGMCYSWRFAALSAASYRLYLAKHVSSEASPFAKSLALLRAFSAETWARAAGELRGPLVPCSYLAEATNMTLGYAEASLRYLTSILNTPLIRVLTSLIDNRTMGDWLRDARAAYLGGNYPLAMGLSVYVLSEIEFRMDAPNTVLRCLKDYWAKLYTIAGPAFAVPSVYYHNYAKRFETNTTRGDAITGFQLEAAALAWLLPGVFLHAVPQEAAAATQAGTVAGPMPAWLPYGLVAAEALLLGAVGAASLRAATVGKEV